MRKASPESQKNEYKTSWQNEYFNWICGYANSKGGVLYVGVNDDGYVTGLDDTRYLLDTLPNQVTSKMGIVIEVDHDSVPSRGENLKYNTVPDDIASKPENLYVRGLLTISILDEIDANPSDVLNVSTDLQKLFDAAPNFVKQLRKNTDYRSKVRKNLNTWLEQNPIHVNSDGSLEYVWITVAAYPYGISYDGHYYTRAGGTTRELTGMSLSSFLMERAGKHWDGMPMPGITVADLDKDAIEAYRKKAARKQHSEADVNVPDEQIISDLQLIDHSPGNDGNLMRAAVLMFHPDPEKYVTGACVKIAYYAPEGAYGANKSDDIIYNDVIHGPLLLQADNVVDLVYTKYLKALVSYDGLQRVETFMFPKEAFREVILNAIDHKLYESGNPIQIRVYDDRIEVFNQGHWPEDIDLGDVYTKKHSSYPHNPNIAKVFFNAGEIEAYGSGFKKIKIECDKANAPYPEIETTPNGVTVTIHACDLYMKLLKHGRYWNTYPDNKVRNTYAILDSDGNYILDSDGNKILGDQVEDVGTDVIKSLDHMSDVLSAKLGTKEKNNILPIYEYLKKNDTITAKQAAEVTGKSSSTVNRYLQRLVDLGVLVAEGGPRNRLYRRL